MNYITEIQKQAHVKNHFLKQQELYNGDINMAIYMDLSEVEKIKVFDILTLNQKQDFAVNFYGFRMGLDDHVVEKLYKLFIREMDSLLRNEVKRKYYVIYFDCSSENKNCFDLLKDIFKRLPAIYFVKLHKLFHINPRFLTKSLESINFTSWSKLFHKHVEYVDNAQHIQHIQQLKIFNILNRCPKQITKGIKVHFENSNMVRSQINVTKRPKPFDCLKRQLNQYTLDEFRGVPLILSILVQTMKQSRELYFTEGIFRVAGSIEDEEDLLKDIIDSKSFRIIDTEKHCKRSIAGLTKKIFTQSSTPLIPYSIYNYLLNQNIDENNITTYWKTIIYELPLLNRQILCYLTQFLHDFIVKNKQHNKMNTNNLSVVFTPCFFRAKECSIADLMSSGKFAAFFKWWLQHYDQIISSNGVARQNQNDKTQNQMILVKLDDIVEK